MSRTTVAPRTSLSVDEINLADPEFGCVPIARVPLLSCAPSGRSSGTSTDFCGAGFRALIKHADIVTVSRDASTFNSANGVHVGDQPEVLEEVSRVTRTPAYASDFCSVRAVLRDGEYYPATM